MQGFRTSFGQTHIPCIASFGRSIAFQADARDAVVFVGTDGIDGGTYLCQLRRIPPVVGVNDRLVYREIQIGFAAQGTRLAGLGLWGDIRQLRPESQIGLCQGDAVPFTDFTAPTGIFRHDQRSAVHPLAVRDNDLITDLLVCILLFLYHGIRAIGIKRPFVALIIQVAGAPHHFDGRKPLAFFIGIKQGSHHYRLITPYLHAA